MIINSRTAPRRWSGQRYHPGRHCEYPDVFATNCVVKCDMAANDVKAFAPAHEIRRRVLTEKIETKVGWTFPRLTKTDARLSQEMQDLPSHFP